VSGAVKKGEAFPNLKDFKIEGKLPEDTKGKVVVIDFWASWCGPCGESFPAMDEIQKKYADKGLIIIAINVDENKADMDEFLKTHKVSFTVVRDAKQKLVEKAGIGTMPSSFILGTDGKVKFTHSGFRGNETKKEYETEIESLLGK
jgi:thiol-disulfide isomerase/thioredoxin